MVTHLYIFLESVFVRMREVVYYTRGPSYSIQKDATINHPDPLSPTCTHVGLVAVRVLTFLVL